MDGYEIPPAAATLDRMEMLFWRLDLIKRSFINLNDCRVGVLGRENYRFFKDREYRERVLFPDDRALLEKTVAGFKNREPVRIVFRVQEENLTHWFKLTGWPTEDKRYYEGAVEEISEHVAWLRKIFEQHEQHLLDVEGVDYPVAVFTARGQKLLSANAEFLALFESSTPAAGRYLLSELISSDIKFPLFLERLFLETSLEKDVLLNLPSVGKSRSSCRFEHFLHGGEGYIRMAVVAPPARRTEANGRLVPVRSKAARNLCAELTECASIDEMLVRIYRARNIFPGMDAVMFSDIYARKNRVYVYATGDMQEPLEPGAQFPYTGTIAENIEKENLEYLIVDDTQSSIKAIDWMLFVPKGIASYVAKALYVRGAMRTVLIFCSRSRNTFREEHVAAVTEIATAFHQQLKQIRKSK